MSALRDALDELAAAAPVAPERWTAEALTLAEQRQRRAYAAGIGATLVVLVVVVGSLLAPHDRRTSPPSAPSLPSRFDPPTKTPPSVLKAPIGAAVALVVNHAGSFLVDAEGGALRRVPYATPHGVSGQTLEFKAGDACGGALSPDGTRLAWTDCGVGVGHGSPPTAVHLIVLASGKQRTVPVSGVTDDASTVELTWAPDNAMVGVSGSNSAAVLRLSDGHIDRVPGHAGRPMAWSPDGRLFAIADNSTGDQASAVYDRSMTKVAQVPAKVPGGGSVGQPLWSADSRSLLRWTDAYGAPVILQLPLDGGPARRIALKGVLADINRSSPLFVGRRHGGIVLQVSPRSNAPGPNTWMTLDLATGKLDPFIDVSQVWPESFASQLLDTLPLRRVTTSAPPLPTPTPPSPGATAPPVTDMAKGWTSTVTFEGVTLPVPDGWVAAPVTVPNSHFSIACVHPAASVADDRCVDGALVQRVTTASAAGQVGNLQFTPSADLRVCTIRRGSVFAYTAFSDTLDGRPAQGAGLRCRDSEALAAVGWALPDAGLIFRARTATAIAAVRAARIQDQAGPRSSVNITQGNGVMLDIPFSWTDFSRSSICFGVVVGQGDSCPLDGILVRGKPFFTGKAGRMRGGAHTGGPATPALESPVGYVSGERKRMGDIPTGCDGLAGLNYTSSQDAGGTVLTPRLHEQRTISGKQADYREFDARCPDGSTFVLRRWWVASELAMFDSYDRPGGMDPAAVDAVLANGILWYEGPLHRHR